MVTDRHESADDVLQSTEASVFANPTNGFELETPSHHERFITRIPTDNEFADDVVNQPIEEVDRSETHHLAEDSLECHHHQFCIQLRRGLVN